MAAHLDLSRVEMPPGTLGSPPSHNAEEALEIEACWRALVETSTAHISLLERDGTIRFLNHLPAGLLPEDVLGATAYRLLTPEYHEPFRAALDQVFRTEQPAKLEVAAFLPRMDQLRSYSVCLGPVSIDGKVTRVVCVSTDTTERKRAERFANAEHAVTRALVQSQQLADTAPRVVQAICECLNWDVGALWILDSEARVLRNIGVWHLPGCEAPTFERACRQCTFVKGVGMPGRIWASQRSEWISNVTTDTNFPRAPMALQDGLCAACGFPIQNGKEFLGLIEFFSRSIQKPDQQLLDMMDNVGGQISRYVAGRRVEQLLHERQREFSLARQIQQGLLPHAMPMVPGFAFGGAARFHQETGGDYYDFFPLVGSGLGIAIGDASGHGIGAALLVAETRGALRTLALTHRVPATILGLISRRLCDDLDLVEGHFVTFFLARLDTANRSLDYSNAGHCPGYILDRAGNVRCKLESTNLPLGLEPAAEFLGAPPVTLQSGDLVLLFTDGAVESMSPAGLQFGPKRVLDVVRTHIHETPVEICQKLVAAVDDFCWPLTPHDDIAVIIVKVDADD